MKLARGHCLMPEPRPLTITLCLPSHWLMRQARCRVPGGRGGRHGRCFRGQESLHPPWGTQPCSLSYEITAAAAATYGAQCKRLQMDGAKGGRGRSGMDPPPPQDSTPGGPSHGCRHVPFLRQASDRDLLFTCAATGTPNYPSFSATSAWQLAPALPRHLCLQSPSSSVRLSPAFACPAHPPPPLGSLLRYPL